MMKRSIGTAATAVTVALTLTACAGGGGGSATGGTTGDTLRIGTMTAPTSLDTKDAIGSALPFFQATYDTLIKREPQGDYSSMLATEWSYDDARTTLSLTLRDDVTFDDGTAFDADAAKANLDRFRDSDGSNAEFLAGVETTVVDPTHLDVKLEQPDPGLLFYLSDSAGLMANPAKFAVDDGLVTTPDGTGPYTFDTSKSAIGTTWVFERRADYWGDTPDFGTVTMTVFDNENAIVNGLKTGQLDTAVLQTADQQLAVKDDSALTALDTEFDFQGLLLFDRDGAVTPELADPRVRQALNHAIDRETLLEVVRGGSGTVTDQVWGTDTQGFDSALDDKYPHDVDKAKKLLADAGHANGFDITLPRMTSIVTDNIASAISANFAEIGVTVEWADVDQSTALSRIFRQREFSAMVMNMGQSSNDWIVYSSLIAPGTFNFFGTSDDEIDALAAEARTASESDAADIYTKMNERIVDQAWFVPFYRMNYQLVTASGVTAEPQAGMAVPSIYNYSHAS